MSTTAQFSWDRAERQVEDMMEQGMSFGRVEDAIEAAQMPSDQKAALWLLAWSLRDPALQRRDARRWASLVQGGYESS